MTVNVEYYQAQWLGETYIKATEDIFAQVDAYLGKGPKRILDIGCGFANVSKQFQEKYGSELWLLDGDMITNPEDAKRVNKFGPVDDFQFYTPVSDLKAQWDRQGMQYTFVDANNISIPEDVKFDFVCSWISCGFHYPVGVYKDLIKKHTTEDSVVIMDFRRKSLFLQQQDFEIVKRLDGEQVQKKYRLHIKLV